MKNINPDPHPVMTELKIDPTMSMAILSHLLYTNTISRTTIQDAWQHINPSPQMPKRIQEDNKNSSSKSVSQEPNQPRNNLEPNEVMTVADTAIISSPATTTSASAIRTRHIALHVYYDGGSYSGLAENIGQANDTSIERAVFLALKKANFITARDEQCQYSRCGRTDKGVSACGQIIALQMKSAFPIEATRQNPNENDDNNNHSSDHFGRVSNDELPKNSFETRTVWVPPRKSRSTSDSAGTVIYTQKCIKEYAYDTILNNLLPAQIRILGWCPVTNNFSARFSCSTRVYRYFFVAPHHQLPLVGQLSLDRMKQGLQHMVGTHDFRNFCKMDVEKVYNFVRTIHEADILVETTLNNVDICFVHIVGQAFLWHQIRCIVHVLFLIGRSYEDPSIVLDLLNIERYPGKPSYPLADERPLVLHECHYTNLSIGYSVTNLWNTVSVLEQQWEEHILAAARIRNCINNLQRMVVRANELLDFATAKVQQRAKKQRGTPQQHLNTLVSPVPTSSSDTITWEEALHWLETNGIIPDPSKLVENVYTPLLQRAKGTTYEEKVLAIQQKDSSSKRQQKYNDNVIKKRKTKDEDAAFYNHMTQQGGSSL